MKNALNLIQGNILGSLTRFALPVLLALLLQALYGGVDLLIVGQRIGEGKPDDAGMAIGYFNGYGRTLFVMIQGLVGAFCVRIPVAYIVSTLPGAELFHIGLATPAATVVQIALCFIMLHRLKKKGFYQAFLSEQDQ